MTATQSDVQIGEQSLNCIVAVHRSDDAAICAFFATRGIQQGCPLIHPLIAYSQRRHGPQGKKFRDNAGNAAIEEVIANRQLASEAAVVLHVVAACGRRFRRLLARYNHPMNPGYDRAELLEAAQQVAGKVVHLLLQDPCGVIAHTWAGLLVSLPESMCCPEYVQQVTPRLVGFV